jgi:autotransporter-associated beta strand protein
MKSGAGTLTLTGNNTYSGGTTVAGGLINFNSAANFGRGSIVLNGGGLQWASGTTTDVSSTNGLYISVSGGTLDTNGNNVTLAGTIRNIEGAGGLIKQGLGTLTLTGNNTYSGGTTVNGGLINFSSASNLGSGQIALNGGGLQWASGTTTDVSSTNGLYISVSGGTLDTNGNNVTLAGTIRNIEGAGGLIKQGLGTLTLTGNNTYSGGTTVNGGTLRLGSGGSLASTGALAVNGGTFDLNGHSQTVGALSGTGGFIALGTGTLTAGNSSDTTLASVISGSGGLEKVGSGTLTLTGNNTYTGATNVVAGVLTLASSTALGSSVVTVANGASLSSLSGTDITIGNRLSIAGSGLSNTGAINTAGSATFTGLVTLTGSSTIVSTYGRLTLGGGVVGDLGGTNDLTIGGAGRVVIGNGLRVSGTVTYNGSDTLELATGSIVSAGLRINSGTVKISDGGVSGAITGDVVNMGSLVFDRSELVSLSGAVSGTGSITQSGSGILVLTGANTYTGGTTVAAGTLRGTTTSLQGAILNNSSVEFVQQVNGTYAGTMSGTGALTKSGAGTLILTGNNAYTGGTTISGGELQVGNGGTSGSIAGNVTDNGTLTFSRSDNLSFDGAISGTGLVKQIGLGTVTLTGDNSSFGGSMLVAQGVLKGNSTSLHGNIYNFGTLVFNQGSTGAFANTVTGSGTVLKTGAGKLSFTNTLDLAGGTFEVQQGRASINGTLTATTIQIDAGGELGGSGTITGNVIHNGLAAPGNSIGTLNIIGTYAHNGSYEAEVNGAGAGDRVNVTGTATVAGTVQAVAALGIYPLTSTYTILNATGGVTGTYGSVTSNYPFLLRSLGYDAQNVYLTLQVGGFSAAAQTPNQAAVAGVLDGNIGAASGDFATVLGGLATATLQQGQAAFTALSGQNYSGFSSSMMQGAQLFLTNFASQAGGGSSGGRIALAEACSEDACGAGGPALWSAWGGALGGLGTITGNSNSGTLTYNAGGFAAGLDRLVAPGLRIGATMGYLNGQQWVSGFSGSGTSDTVQAGLYGTWDLGHFYADALAGYAYSFNHMTRDIALPNLASRTARGQTGANQVFGQFETGYRVDLAEATKSYMTPFARLQGVTATQDGFSETGAGSLNLTVAAQTTNSLRSVFGMRTGAAFDMGWRDRLALSFSLGWAHEFADTARPVTATLAGAPGAAFTTYGVSPQRDGAAIGLSAGTEVADATSIYLRYEGTISGLDNSHSLSVGLKAIW